MEVVVGLPKTLRGTDGPAVAAARAYGAALAAPIAPVPVVYVDERLTTVSADRQLAEAGVRGRARRKVVDQVAATRILQNRLDNLAGGRRPVSDHLGIFGRERAARPASSTSTSCGPRWPPTPTEPPDPAAPPHPTLISDAERAADRPSPAPPVAGLRGRGAGGHRGRPDRRVRRLAVHGRRGPRLHAAPGDTEVIVRVQSGDGIGDIANTLADAGWWPVAEAFENQAALDADVQALRPGYYRVRQNASAQATADALVAKENRVGQVRLIPGRQLADVTAVSTDPNVAPIDGARLHLRDHRGGLCAAERRSRTASPPTSSGRSPRPPIRPRSASWNGPPTGCRAAPDPRKRLEGMILPGDFDIPPGSDAGTGAAGRRQRVGGAVERTDIIADSAAARDHAVPGGDHRVADRAGGHRQRHAQGVPGDLQPAGRSR